MENSFDSSAIQVACAIVLNLVGYLILLFVTAGDTNSVLVILTVIDSAAILWRKLDKVQKLLEKEQ